MPERASSDLRPHPGNLGSSDAGIAMTRRLLLEAVSAYRERGIKPNGETTRTYFMVRAVSLTLPESTSWVDYPAGLHGSNARRGFRICTLIRIQLLALILNLR